MMNRLKDNSSVDPNNLYSNTYLLNTELGYNNNNNNNTLNLAFVNEFKIDTSVGGSHSAPTSLMTNNINNEQFNYSHQYTPNMDYIQCVQSTDDSFGSSSSSGTKIQYQIDQGQIQAQSYMHSSGLSIDSYFSNGDTIQMKPIEVDENDNSPKDDLRRSRGRGRGSSSSYNSARKRHVNQENNIDDSRNSNQVLNSNSVNNRGKHGKALARHPFIPSYMDPNNGPHLCVVCKHNASGFHYRVMACEGCKGFFRRTVQNNLVYTCKFSNKCEIQPHNRAQCQECRWRKCLEVGMAKDLVLSEDARRAKKELIAANRAKKLTSDRLSNKGSNEFNDPTSPVKCEKLSFRISEDDERFINQIRNAFDQMDTSKTELTADFTDPTAAQILQCVLDHHVTSLIIKCDIVDESNIHSAKFNYSQQFNILTVIVKSILKRVVTFALMLPRFSELSINDQIVLLKSACFDIISLRNATDYDSQSQTLKLEPDFILTKDALKVHKLAEPTYVFVNRISSLSMDYIEICLMAALALLSCDRMGLHDVSKVESLQDDILCSIDCYMKHNSLDNTHRQSELYATILPELRSTTSWHTQIMINSIDSSINNFLPALKAIYHYADVSIPVCSPFAESSNSSRFITTNQSSPSNSSKTIVTHHPVYSNSEVKYITFPYLSHTVASLYPGLDTTSPNHYNNTNTHLTTNSGQHQHLILHSHQHPQHHMLSPIDIAPSSSSFTELLIDSSTSSDLKVNQLLITDKYITTTATQESLLSSSLATHANHNPVTNHNLSTINDPVFDFSTDLI